MDQAAAALRRISHEEVLLAVLVQLIVIILAARLFAALARRIGQPAVVGEIAAGLALGPSLLGRLDFVQRIFHPSMPGIDPALAGAAINWVFGTLSHIGLVFLLFLVGLEFDVRHLRTKGGSALAISLLGVAIPFALGLGLATILLPHVEPHPLADGPPSPLGFTLFLGTALSITAIPVLARIVMELGIARTRLGTITMSAAVIDDATGWILLAAVAAIVRGSFEPARSAIMIAETIGFALFLGLVARPVLRWWARRALARADGALNMTDLAVMICVLFGCAIVTNRIGIFAIFGAFLLGAVMSTEEEFRRAVTLRMRDFVTVFFLPIFFTYTGVRTDVGTLRSPTAWLFAGLVLVAGVAGKFGGCALAARLTGFSSRESACIGAMMNTRGLMELIVVNVGFELRVIPPSVYCMLVIMALVTTVMTTPLLLWLMRGTELEPHVRQSGFLRHGPANRPPAESTAAE